MNKQTADSTKDKVGGIHFSVVSPPAIGKVELSHSSSSRCELPSGADFLPTSSTVGLDSEEENPSEF